MSLAEAKVSCISFNRIHAATQTESSTQRVHLTPWDLRFLPVESTQTGILFNPKPSHSTWLADLKTSLSTSLDQFYVLAGRLAMESNQDNTISIFLHCNNQGADFIYATADITTSDILSPLHVPRIVHDLFSLNDLINYDQSGSQPMLSVQVTELIDGVFLGFTMNHMVVDGSSFWHFINSWSEISRTGSCQTQKRPIFQRWFLNTTDLPIRIPASKIQRSITTQSAPPPVPTKILHFTPDNILKLKQKANLEINNNTVKISSFQAVVAHLWIGVTRARNLDADQTVQHWMSIGNRGRLDPPLPDEYFGNCVSACNATAKVGDLVNRGIGFAARLLNQAVSSHTNAQICTDWENFVKEPWFVMCSGGSMSNDMLTGMSPRFNMYGNDFGWGRPIAVRGGRTSNRDGIMLTYQGAVAGSMDIEANLSPETMKRLGEDNWFLEFIDPKGL